MDLLDRAHRRSRRQARFAHHLDRGDEAVPDPVHRGDHVLPVSVVAHRAASVLQPAGQRGLADSLCAFNPAYGQGMTVAAKEAELLAGILAGCHSSADLPRALECAQAAIATRVKGPWMLSTGSDLRYPTTVGATQTRMDKVVNKYLDRVLAAVPVDAAVSAAFLRVLNLIDEPQALFSPSLMPRVLRPRRHSAPVENGFVVGKQLSRTTTE